MTLSTQTFLLLLASIGCLAFTHALLSWRRSPFSERLVAFAAGALFALGLLAGLGVIVGLA